MDSSFFALVHVGLVQSGQATGEEPFGQTTGTTDSSRDAGVPGSHVHIRYIQFNGI